MLLPLGIFSFEVVPLKADVDFSCPGESYPCLGRIVALRGNDSHQLWNTSAHSGLFELNCGKIDVNKDGQMDCVGTGRLATVVAFDPRNGLCFYLP